MEPKQVDKYLYLSSSNRIKGTSTSCLIRTTQGYEGVKKVCVSTVSIPNMIYSVTEFFHIPLQENGGAITNVSIPRIYYTPTTMAAALATALTTASPGMLTYTVTYGATTNKFTFSATGNFGFAFTTDHALYPYNEAYVTTGFQNSASGFAYPPDQSSTTVATHTSTGQVIFQSKYLFVNVAPLSGGAFISGDTQGSQSALAIVPIDKNATDILLFTENSYYSQEAEFVNQSVNSFYMSLNYSDGSQVDLNNADWAVMVRMSF